MAGGIQIYRVDFVVVMVRGEEEGEAEGIRPEADSESCGGGLDRRRLQATPRKKPVEGISKGCPN